MYGDTVAPTETVLEVVVEHAATHEEGVPVLRATVRNDLEATGRPLCADGGLFEKAGGQAQAALQGAPAYPYGARQEVQAGTEVTQLGGRLGGPPPETSRPFCERSKKYKERGPNNIYDRMRLPSTIQEYQARQRQAQHVEAVWQRTAARPRPK